MKHFFSLLLGLISLPTIALAQAPTLVARLPAANAPAAPRNAAVELTFSEAMSAQTAAPDAVRVVSQWRGLLPGTYQGGGTSTIAFTPSRYFLPGEPLRVAVTSQARSQATGTAAVPTQYQFTAQAPSGSGRFGEEFETIGVGSSPNSVVVGDFNADGRPDLATANQASRNVSIRLGAGNGTFTNAADVVVGSGPQGVAVADFNADGNPDLAVTTTSSASVSIRLGVGNGTFTSAADVVVGTNPDGVAVADFNADGRPDLVTANLNSNNVSIRLGAGDGTFGGTINVAVSLNPRSVAAADVDGDGDMDLIAPNSSTNSLVSIRLNDGTGTPVPLPVELVSFTAARTAPAQVQLRWATAQEKNNAGFQVEKSYDGRRWQQIGFVPGQGTSTTARQYRYPDAEAGAAYYRLVQQDQDGPETHSPVRYVARGAAPALQLFPNPATTTVQLPGADADAEVQLLSLQGRVLRRYPAGTTRFDLRGLPAGLYLVRSGQQAARLVVE